MPVSSIRTAKNTNSSLYEILFHHTVLVNQLYLTARIVYFQPGIFNALIQLLATTENKDVSFIHSFRTFSGASMHCRRPQSSRVEVDMTCLHASTLYTSERQINGVCVRV